MNKAKGAPLLVVALFLAIALSVIIVDNSFTIRATPNAPYEDSGTLLDVHDFARNVTGPIQGQNGTSFIYSNSSFPSGYRGYLLQANVSQLYRSTDPVPNGSFENISAFSETWTLTNLEFWDQIVQSITPETGHNATDGLYVMDVQLPYERINGQRTAYIDNDFNYTSEFFPDITEVRFNIKLEDITDQEWLVLRVAIWNQGSEKGVWTKDLKTLKAEIGENTWHYQTFLTTPVNGQIKLRITLQKLIVDNRDVRGHIYFDNFQYIIGSYVKPSEAGLTLNSEPIVDSPTLAPAGSVEYYSNQTSKEEASWDECWSIDQPFEFTSTTYSNLTFYYEFAMYVKNITQNVASTSFSAPVDGIPEWTIQYYVPFGRPPVGHTHYAFGLHLPSGWDCTYINDSLGTPITYSMNPSSNFVKIAVGQASADETYRLYATSQNYVELLQLQKANSPLGPWENLTSSGFYVIGDYVRVIAQLKPIDYLSPQNFANVTIHYPNGTDWHHDDAVTFLADDTLNSTAWEITESDIEGNIIGQNWIATVSFSNGSQCGKRQAQFTIVIETKYEKIDPTDGETILWGDSVHVEVTWQNNYTGGFITDASTARVRYLDRNLVVQYVTMTPDGFGGYSTDVSTTLMSPDRTAQIHVELFRYGCQNVSYSEGTHIVFTINLVGKLNLVMIKPTLVTGPNEFTGETSAIEGYTSIVKFYDPYHGAYVLNGSATWPDVIVNYTSYEDPEGGPTEWVFRDTNVFSHNSSERTFLKDDESYVSVDRVKYEVSMRVEGASWDYETHDFTIIIIIEEWATDLDALRTTITYPPTGDGWTNFDETTDNYDAHVYWSESFNITVFYHYAENTTGIPSANAKIQIDLTPPVSMVEIGNGYYRYIVDTSSLEVGLTTVYVNATIAGHAGQTILIQLFIEARQTELTKDHPGSTAIIPWNGIFSVTFTFDDIVESSPIPIPDANVWVDFSSIALPYSIVNHTDGTYTISFTGNVDEGTYAFTVIFNRDKHQSQNQMFELTIRLISTQSIGIANTPTVPWGDNAIITLTFTDTDNSVGIDGASFNFTSHGIWLLEGVDYWINPQGDGEYTLTLNTTKVPTGTHGYTLFVTFTKDHYQTSQTAVFFQVRDIQTILFITDTPDGTIIPHGDVFTIILQYNNTNHVPSSIIGDAVIDCDWHHIFWNYTYDAGQGVYIVMIQLRQGDSEGTYILNLQATKPHYQIGSNIQTFVIRTIQTSAQSSVSSIDNIPIGSNVTFTVEYNDLDHLGEPIPYATISITWDSGYYTVYTFPNGTYLVELNTTTGSMGSNYLQVEIALPPHYEPASVYVTLNIIPIPLIIQVIEPSLGQLNVEYNTLIVATVNVTNHLGAPIDDAIVAYRWANRDWVNMTWIGNGLYNVTFLADASVGFNHQVTIRAENSSKYTADFTTFLVSISPTETVLDNISPATFVSIIGESFTISINFTTLDGLPISDANVSYVVRDRSGVEMLSGFFINVAPGIYNATIDNVGLIFGEYKIFVSASKVTMSEKEITFLVTLTKIPTLLFSVVEPITVLTGTDFEVRVTLNDTHNHLLVSDANLTISIPELGIVGHPLFDHGNGTYSYIGNSGLLQSTYIITIVAEVPQQYQQPESLTIYLIVNQNPFIQSIGSYVAVAAIIIIVVLAVWFAYARIFTIPWVVRKMRKMSKTISKGDLPTLSKSDVSRIADRSDQLTEIVNPYYGVIGLSATGAVLPAEIEWKEKDAEDDAIWGELKSLPFVEYEQRLELFQQMKQIAPSERVWFLDDLKKQMADRTRFARKVKEPEISKNLEEALQARLATFPALSRIEKERIAAQLRKLPKEDWDEIFLTLAASQKLPMPQVKVLGPDELPSLSEEEKKRLLEEIKDLSDEERQKVLQTFRDKRSKDTPKGKVVKGKKEYIIDDSSESK
ncbi:MAG: hypothetical protein ACFE8O_02270 [Candidatus Hermodarchaeota archaeon]